MPTDLALRLLWILAVAVAAHLFVLLVRSLSGRFMRTRAMSEAKLRTVTRFATDALVFAVYFSAFGFALQELGVSLTTYLASATIIGLAVSFGSQGVVQDVIAVLTNVFSDLLDIGDMVEIGGQIGIVEGVGLRFTVLVNFAGARVYVPNRTISNVINYPKGYIRAFLDVRLPADPALWSPAQERLTAIANAAHEQFPGIVLLPPSVEAGVKTAEGYGYLRVKFRIWPGQGSILDQTVRPSFVQAMRAVDERFADWMLTIHYRAEPPGGDPARRLPQPAALARPPRAQPGPKTGA